MKKYITRNRSVIAGKTKLEHLYTIKDFPAFISYVNDNKENKDVRADLSFGICPKSGIIQLEKVLPLDIVYQAEHSTGLGQTWNNMYEAFAKFMAQYPMHDVLEIGGGNGALAKLYTERNKNITWTIVEPLPLCKESKQIKILKKWFNQDFKYDRQVDAIIHSHTLEHIYNPTDFLDQIYRFLQTGNYHIFSVPNLYIWLKRKYTNAINFEHTIFLTEYFIDYLVQKSGFKIVDKKYHQNHSIFYATERLEHLPDISYESQYVEYKKIFEEFINYHNRLIANLNKKMDTMDCDVYLFGAHIFSQFLFEFGLDKSKIKGILDNSRVKQIKRLYGTPFTTYPLTEIASYNKVAVIVKAAEYQQEIKKQLIKINKRVIILE